MTENEARILTPTFTNNIIKIGSGAPMSQTLIRAFDNKNRPILAGNKPVEAIHFNLVKLRTGETYRYRLPEFESVVVPMAGTCDLTADGEPFSKVGCRATIWDGKADAVYVGPNADVAIVAQNDCEIAIAGGLWDRPMSSFRISPEEVDMVDVGSNETKSRRRIFHILGQNGAGRAGYPPHKHDADQPGETAHQEVYHWRFNPRTGFGSQLWYRPGEDPKAYMTR